MTRSPRSRRHVPTTGSNSHVRTTTPEKTFIYAAIALVPPTPLWIVAWCAWTGRYRRWAIKPVVFDALNGGLAFHKRNYTPLLAGVLGTTWAALFINDSLADHVYGNGPAETSAVIAICGVSLVLLVWWPEFLRPAWHKDRAARGGDHDKRYELVWPPEEWRTSEEREAQRDR